MKWADLMSERILFGLLIIVGYFGVGAVAALLIPKENTSALSLTRDILMTVGPLLGMIVQSIWKADKIDRQNADTAATLAAKTPNLSGAAVPVTLAEGPTP